MRDDSDLIKGGGERKIDRRGRREAMLMAFFPSEKVLLMNLKSKPQMTEEL